MIKIKLAELFKHRNETTFRPYMMAKDLFEDIGVQFVTEGKCDLTWVAQASFNDKKNSYTYGNCVSKGLHFLESEVQGDYVLFDGQDSASLVGSFDVLKNSGAKLLLKNTLYNSFEDYLTPWKMGRMYWGEGEPMIAPNDKHENTFGYALSESDRELYSKVRLTGCNWLSTIQPRWYDYNKLNKDIDVFAMFSYPAKENWEFGCPTNIEYDAHRKMCMDELDRLQGVKIARLDGGVKVPIEQYYNLMSRAKIVIAPFGYGEIAPRDIEAAQFGAVLIKPTMAHLNTIPNIYSGSYTYMPCSWTFHDLNKKIHNILGDYKDQQVKFVENMRGEYRSDYTAEKLVMYTHWWLTQLEGFETE